MKIGVFLFGISYNTNRHGNQVDFRHCWSNIEDMLIIPFKEQGHDVKVFTCTYIFQDKEIEKEFFKMIHPDKSLFLTYKGSDKTTCKENLFRLIQDRDDIDLVIFTRFDIHFKKKIVFDNINLSKFNFLFREDNVHCWNQHKYTTDNFYIWPYIMTDIVKVSLIESFNYNDYRDSHALYRYLINRISEEDIHFVSDTFELSDTNSFYTLCIPDMIREKRTGIHPDVLQRFSP